jgi:hypothetical protein
MQPRQYTRAESGNLAINNRQVYENLQLLSALDPFRSL